MPSLRESLNQLVHDHLFATITGLVLTVGTAIGFYWVTQLDLVAEVSANTERSQNNENLGNQIRGSLQNIELAVGNIRVDAAVTREKVESLEEEVKKQ